MCNTIFVIVFFKKKFRLRREYTNFVLFTVVQRKRDIKKSEEKKTRRKFISSFESKQWKYCKYCLSSILVELKRSTHISRVDCLVPVWLSVLILPHWNSSHIVVKQSNQIQWNFQIWANIVPRNRAINWVNVEISTSFFRLL